MDVFDNDSAGRSLLAVAGPRRRTFLRMAGAAGALGVAAAAIPAQSARAAAATHNFLGSYEGPPGGTTNQWFNQIAAVVPGLNGFRQYDRKPFRDSSGAWHNDLAKKWPAPPYPGYQGPSVFSIYPIPDTVVAVASDAPAILAIKEDPQPGAAQLVPERLA